MHACFGQRNLGLLRLSIKRRAAWSSGSNSQVLESETFFFSSCYHGVIMVQYSVVQQGWKVSFQRRWCKDLRDGDGLVAPTMSWAFFRLVLGCVSVLPWAV